MTDVAMHTVLSTGELLTGIIEWVGIESPTIDTDSVNRMADHIEAELHAIGLDVERTAGEDGWGDLIRARTPGKARHACVDNATQTRAMSSCEGSVGLF